MCVGFTRDSIMNKNIFIYWENHNGTTTPSYIELCRKTLYRHNKNICDIILVDDKSLHQYIPVPNNLFNITSIPHKADFIRVSLLYHHGGIWIDSDCVVLKSFSDIFELMNRYNYIGYYNTMKNISNGFMCAKNKSNIITDIYFSLLNKIESKINFKWTELGSVPITKSCNKYKDSAYIYDMKYMNPIDWREWKLFFEDYQTDYIPQESYTVMLFNEMFKKHNHYIYKKNIEEIINQKNLLARLFKENIV